MLANSHKPHCGLLILCTGSPNTRLAYYRPVLLADWFRQYVSLNERWSCAQMFCRDVFFVAEVDKIKSCCSHVAPANIFSPVSQVVLNRNYISKNVASDWVSSAISLTRFRFRAYQCLRRKKFRTECSGVLKEICDVQYKNNSLLSLL